MKLSLNLEQRKVLSSFLNSLAVAWFVAAFITPSLEPEVSALTYLTYIANMVFALYLSIAFLKEEV